MPRKAKSRGRTITLSEAAYDLITEKLYQEKESIEHVASAAGVDMDSEDPSDYADFELYEDWKGICAALIELEA